MGLFDDMELDTDNSGFDDGFGGSDTGLGSFNDNSGSNGFDLSDDSNNSGDFNLSDDDQGDFGGAFDNMDNTGNNDGQPGGGVKKAALIAVAVGIVGIIAVFLVASKLGNKDDTDTDKQHSNTSTSQNYETNSNDRDSSRVDNIMSNGGSNTQHGSGHQNSEGNNENWKAFDGSAVISFDDDYKELVFTVTEIVHYVSDTDSSNNIAVKTTLTGSLSGMAGCYSLDVPYSKGSRLVVGDEFTVQVQFGTYNGKVVIGEIDY